MKRIFVLLCIASSLSLTACSSTEETAAKQAKKSKQTVIECDLNTGSRIKRRC